MRLKLFEALPDLARGLPADRAAAIGETLTVATLELAPAVWDAPTQPRRGHLGFLALGGALLREVCVGPDWSGEILGRGDILRPWLEDSSSFVEARWTALLPSRLAVLDGAAMAQISRHPELVDDLVERALRRSRSMAIHAVIEGVHRIDERLLLLFWHLAEQRGERLNGQTAVPLPLTHSHLARLVGARRPTVTAALGTLEKAGRIARREDGTWLVKGEPPTPDGIDLGNGGAAD